jgi:predicted TIM-barrel fold metal-dependent hydrolase
MIPLNKYRPVSKLRVPQNIITKAKFPVIDAHNHLAPNNHVGVTTTVEELLAKMEEFNIRMIVDLDGKLGEEGERQLRMSEAYPHKFVTFVRVDFSKLEEPDFASQINKRINEYVRRGAGGIKFLKELGLNVKDSFGKYIKPCDPRLTPIWEAAAKHNIPVLIHIGDPMAFFDPIDETNERYEELIAHPDWSFADPRFYRFNELIESGMNLLRKNPQTRFIIPHVGGVAEDLARVGKMLDEFPNMYIDTAERIAELGRQPYTARDFLIKYQDRVLYGTDLVPNHGNVVPNYRFFETFDEYFHYNDWDEHHQGRWMIYGVGLPDEVLRKIYYENACKVIPRLAQYYYL